MILSFKIYFAFSVIIGIYQFFQTNNKFIRLILVGIIASLLLSAIPLYIKLENHYSYFDTSILLLIFSLILIIIYGLIGKSFSITKRLVIIIPAALILVRKYFHFQNYAGMEFLTLLLIIPIIIYIAAIVFDSKNYENEFGIFILLIADSSFRLCIYLL